MENIDIYNNSFRTIIEGIRGRLTTLEGNTNGGESPFIFPQQWATGDGTESNPWANSCIKTAYANCPISGTIFLRAGYYQLADSLTLAKQIDIIGEGKIGRAHV